MDIGIRSVDDRKSSIGSREGQVCGLNMSGCAAVKCLTRSGTRGGGLRDGRLGDSCRKIPTSVKNRPESFTVAGEGQLSTYAPVDIIYINDIVLSGECRHG